MSINTIKYIPLDNNLYGLVGNGWDINIISKIFKNLYKRAFNKIIKKWRRIAWQNYLEAKSKNIDATLKLNEITEETSVKIVKLFENAFTNPIKFLFLLNNLANIKTKISLSK